MKKLLSFILIFTLCISLAKITPIHATNEFDTIKTNLISMITGKGIETNSEQFKKKIKYIHDEANKVEKLEITNNEFKTLPILNNGSINDKNLNDTFINIYKLALAYKTESSEANSLYNKQEVLTKIKDVLSNTYTKHLADKTKTYTGNWYYWEISMPQNLSKTLILLETELGKDLIEKYLKFMDESLRAGKKEDPKPGDIELTSSYHTGANLMDIALNRILQGSLKQDTDTIKNAVDSLQTAFVKIDPNKLVNNNVDGVYLDDSFIQHHSVAYSGSYGKVFIDKTTQSLNLLKSTNYKINDNSIQFIKNAYEKAFLPIIYEGYVLENVKGRAVSRSATGYADGLVFLESLLVFADYANDNTFKGYAKYIQSKIPDYNKPNFNNLNAFKIADEIKGSTIQEKYIANGFYDYKLMDRDVSIQKDYLFTVARSSNRISKYEYMSKENTMPWLQGDGMHYLYLAGQKHNIHYGNSYFQTIDPLELPGTTKTSEIREDIVKNLDKEYNFDSYKEKRNQLLFFPLATNKVSGSIKNDKIFFSTMQLGDDAGYVESLNPNSTHLPKNFKTYKNVEGNKSWFMLEDQILVMNSNISHPDKSLTLTTTIDNRQYKKEDKISGSIDNNEFKENDTLSKEEHVERIALNVAGRGNIGYYFYNAPKLSIKKETKTGTSQTVRPINGNTNFETQYFKIQSNQTNNSSLAYVILPNKNKADTLKYNPEMKIIRSDNVHHIEYKDTHAYSFFEATKEGIYDVKQPMLILEKKENDTLDLSISDSTLQADTLELELKNDKSYEVISKDDEVTLDYNKIIINTKHKNGKAFNLKLKIRDKVIISAEKLIPSNTLYPAVELTDHNTNISIKAPQGALPTGVKLHAKKIENTTGLDSDLFDITLLKDGVEIQPNKPLLVTVNANPNKKVEKVIYIENNKIKEEQKIIQYNEGDSTITFEVSHLSQYAIVYQNNIIKQTTENTSKKEVQTGDENILMSSFLLLILSSLVFFKLRKA